MASYPFRDEQHEARFAEGRAIFRRGGTFAPLCGARTRNNGACRQAPLAGHRRCLRHAGPKAARAYRQRQFDEMQAGKISYAEFARSEAKRAANRLRDQWKKDPWLHGRTIDLGEHEMAFQGELLHWNGSRSLAPAILDWLRWKFRRLQIDRAQNEAWALLLRDELPRRVRDAGEPPFGWSEQQSVGPATWKAGQAPVSGKRVRRDDRRQKREADRRALPALSKSENFDPLEVARIVSSAMDVLRPHLALCRTDDERDSLVAALVNYSREPQSTARREEWTKLLRVLRER
ncbi:MAG: hypothetical protein EOP24_00795 [Hyphomicrobiales bacterium]|nr:MAG: hypothetical protein EOP24_00795 [Hyphomicrobiales bacterium]